MHSGLDIQFRTLPTDLCVILQVSSKDLAKLSYFLACHERRMTPNGRVSHFFALQNCMDGKKKKT